MRWVSCVARVLDWRETSILYRPSVRNGYWDGHLLPLLGSGSWAKAQRIWLQVHAVHTSPLHPRYLAWVLLSIKQARPSSVGRLPTPGSSTSAPCGPTQPLTPSDAPRCSCSCRALSILTTWHPTHNFHQSKGYPQVSSLPSHTFYSVNVLIYLNILFENKILDLPPQSGHKPVPPLLRNIPSPEFFIYLFFDTIILSFQEFYINEIL